MQVQHIGIFRGLQCLLRHPEGAQQPHPLGNLRLLAHRGPHIAVNNVRTLQVRLVIGDLNEAAIFPGLGKRGIHHVLVHLLCQLLRSHGDKVHPQLGGAHHPCIAHIVPHITGKHHLDLVQRLFAVLLNGHEIGQNLCGVVGVRQTVPHRYAGPFRKVLHNGLLIAPVLDAVKEPSQHLGRILQRLLFPHLGGICVQIRHMGALLRGRHLKGAAGAGGRLFKQQYDVLALHGGLADARTPLGFQIVAEVQQIAQLAGGKIRQRQKAPAL